MGTLNRRALFGFLREGRAPTIIRPRDELVIPREAPAANLPAVREEGPSMPLPEALNPQQSRRGFLGFMGNIGARLAMRPGVARNLMLSPEERVMRAIDQYAQDFGRLNNDLASYNVNHWPDAPTSVSRRIERELARRASDLVDFNLVPGTHVLFDDATMTGQMMPHMLGAGEWGQGMARSIARRAGVPERRVREIMGSNPEEYDRFLTPMVRGPDDLDALHPEEIITDPTHHVRPREQTLRHMMPTDTEVTPAQMERLWSRAPEVDQAIGPEGVREHLDNIEPWLAEMEAREAARSANRPYVADVPEATAYSIPRQPYNQNNGVEAYAMMPTRYAGPDRQWAWNVPDAEDSQIRFLEQNGLMAPRGGALRAPQQNLSPEQSIMRRRRPTTIDQEGNMVEEPQ